MRKIYKIISALSGVAFVIAWLVAYAGKLILTYTSTSVETKFRGYQFLFGISYNDEYITMFSFIIIIIVILILVGVVMLINESKGGLYLMGISYIVLILMPLTTPSLGYTGDGAYKFNNYIREGIEVSWKISGYIWISAIFFLAAIICGYLSLALEDKYE